MVSQLGESGITRNKGGAEIYRSTFTLNLRLALLWP